MKILHLETSSKNCSVAISDGDEILCVCEEISENYKQSESLHTFVQWALEGAKIILNDQVLTRDCELAHLLRKVFASGYKFHSSL